MKRIYLSVAALFYTSMVISQALPNNGFENWTPQGGYEDPDNWSTLNPTTVIFGVITCEKATGADVHGGNAAIKLTTLNVLGQNANGLATTGAIDVVAMTITGGVAYTLRPDSITGWYKCDPQGGDYGFVDFSLLNAAGTDTVGFAHFQTPTTAVTTYTYFAIPINYYNSNTPELARCVMSSSEGVSSVLNSVLIIDDLALAFNTTGVKDPLFTKNTVQFHPLSHRMDVFTQSAAVLSVVDMTGKKIFEKKVEQGSARFTLDQIRPGLYIYFLGDAEKKNTVTGKFIAE